MSIFPHVIVFDQYIREIVRVVAYRFLQIVTTLNVDQNIFAIIHSTRWFSFLNKWNYNIRGSTEYHR